MLRVNGINGEDVASVASDISNLSELSNWDVIPAELQAVLIALANQLGMDNLQNADDLKRLIEIVKLAGNRINDLNNVVAEQQKLTLEVISSANSNYDKAVIEALSILIAAAKSTDNVDLYNDKIALLKQAIVKIKDCYKKLLEEIAVANRYSMRLGEVRTNAVNQQVLGVFEKAVSLINKNIRLKANINFAAMLEGLVDDNVNNHLEVLLDKTQELILKQEIVIAEKCNHNDISIAKNNLVKFYANQQKKIFYKSLNKVKDEIALLRSSNDINSMLEKMWSIVNDARKLHVACSKAGVEFDIKSTIEDLYAAFNSKKKSVADNIIQPLDAAVKTLEESCNEFISRILNHHCNDLVVAGDDVAYIEVEDLLKPLLKNVKKLESAVMSRFKGYGEAATLLPEQDIMAHLKHKKELVKAHKNLQRCRVAMIEKVQAIIDFYKIAEDIPLALEKLNVARNSNDNLKTRLAFYYVNKSKQQLIACADVLEDLIPDYIFDITDLQASIDRVLNQNIQQKIAEEMDIELVEHKISEEELALLEKQFKAITEFDIVRDKLQYASNKYSEAVFFVKNHSLAAITSNTKVEAEVARIFKQEQENLKLLKAAVAKFELAVQQVADDVVDNKELLEHVNIEQEKQQLAAAELKSQQIKQDLTAKIIARKKELVLGRVNLVKNNISIKAKQLEKVFDNITIPELQQQYLDSSALEKEARDLKCYQDNAGNVFACSAAIVTGINAIKARFNSVFSNYKQQAVVLGKKFDEWATATVEQDKFKSPGFEKSFEEANKQLAALVAKFEAMKSVQGGAYEVASNNNINILQQKSKAARDNLNILAVALETYKKDLVAEVDRLADVKGIHDVKELDDRIRLLNEKQADIERHNLGLDLGIADKIQVAESQKAPAHGLWGWQTEQALAKYGDSGKEYAKQYALFKKGKVDATAYVKLTRNVGGMFKARQIRGILKNDVS